MTSTRLLPYVWPFGMFDGPIAVHVAGPADGAAKARRPRLTRLLLGCEAEIFPAAFAIAAANAFAAGGLLSVRALAERLAFARKARFADPTFGCAAFGTSMVSTTSPMSRGSRSAK